MRTNKKNPLDGIREFFLARYANQDFLIQEKVKILYLIFGGILAIIIPIYLILFERLLLVSFHRSVILSFMAITVVLIILLRQGYFRLASHGFLILAFMALWSTFFYNLQEGDLRLFDRLATVVIICALLGFTPFIVAHMTHAIIGYYLVNAAVFTVFIIMVYPKNIDSRPSLAIYAVDVSIAFLISCVISFHVFRINKEALRRSQAAERAARTREDLFRAIIQESPQTVLIARRDGSLSFPGNLKESFFGYSTEEIPTIDRWWELAYPDPEYRELIISEWKKLQLIAPEGGGAKSIETKILTRDGSIRDVMLRYAALREGEGGLLLLDDVTDRRIIEHSLLASERRYRNLYESMLDGFLSCDMDGYLIEFNRAFMEMTGYGRSELHRMTIWELTPQQWHEAQKRIMREQLFTIGHTDIFEKEYYRKDGSTFPVELRLYLTRNEYGSPSGFWAITRDISKRKQAEQELLKASKIESIGVFAGGIAHDFNNILTAILGNISLVKLDTSHGSSTFCILEEAEKACRHAKELTMQLLTFSKGGMPIKRISSIRDLVVDTTEFALRGSPLSCDISIPPDLWSAEIDTGQISQVIHNLVLNAREAMPDGGKISIVAENREIGESSDASYLPGKYIALTVSDTGCGIPHQYHAKVFDPFFTTKTTGSGLGLSVTYSIVKKHGGYISLESEEGAGARFTILLPASDTPAEAPVQRQNAVSAKTGKALIMDDDELVLSVGRKMLERMGFRTVTARDGKEAIQYYREALQSGDPFSIVIMDLTVPGGIGGKEAVRILREFDPKVKAIVSSGYSNDPVMSNFRDYGFCGVVTKPFSYEELSDALQGL